MGTPEASRPGDETSWTPGHGEILNGLFYAVRSGSAGSCFRMICRRGKLSTITSGHGAATEYGRRSTTEFADPCGKRQADIRSRAVPSSIASPCERLSKVACGATMAPPSHNVSTPATQKRAQPRPFSRLSLRTPRHSVLARRACGTRFRSVAITLRCSTAYPNPNAAAPASPARPRLTKRIVLADTTAREIAEIRLR